MLFLFAPTVPSEPSPKNNARTVPAGSMSSAGSYGRLVPVTSSVMPIVNRGRGRSAASSAKIPATMPGVNSFDDSPYRPPITSGMTGRSPAACASASAASTSRNSGSPSEPGSLVRSSTASRRALAGIAASTAAAGKGRNSRTWTTPTFSSRAARWAAVSAAVWPPEPMITITRSACGSPEYSTRRYWRPVAAAKASIASMTAPGILA